MTDAKKYDPFNRLKSYLKDQYVVPKNRGKSVKVVGYVLVICTFMYQRLQLLYTTVYDYCP